jgi:phosphatidylglycerol lysyltransferase
MVNWLAAESRRLQQTIAVYSVGAESVADFRDAGFAVNKFGEEPVLPLGAIDWRGHAFEWVRRQTRACRRRGLAVQEVRDEATRAELAVELVEIQTADLLHRIYSRPLRLLEGQFDAGSLQRRRLFVVRSSTGSGGIEAFLAASPILDGQQWAFETYRKRTTAPRGTMPFLFRSVIDQLQAEGVAQVSLCLVPGRNVCSDGDVTCDRRIRWLLELWYKRLHWLFNVAGQDFFKSRFRPEYVERFLCVYPQNTWLSFLSFLKVAGGLHPDLKNLARRAWPWRRKIR